MYSLIFRVLLKYFVRIKKYSRGAVGQIFVIYGQPMECNIIISYILLRCRILYLYTKNCSDLNKGRYLKPSKSRAISFDGRLYINDSYKIIFVIISESVNQFRLNFRNLFFNVKSTDKIKNLNNLRFNSF